jgi:hypothetical protein
MLASGGNVHLALEELLQRAAAHPDEEPTIRRALVALRTALSDSAAINEISTRFMPTPLPNPRQFAPPRRIVVPADANSTRRFAEELQALVQSRRPLHLKELQSLAEEVGPQYGRFPTKGELRIKTLLVEWFRANIDVLADDLREIGRRRNEHN